MDGQGFAAAARRLKPIGGFFLIGLAALTVSRVALALWQQEGISEVDGWWQVFLQGARVDMASLCLLLTPAALLVLALPARAASTRAMRRCASRRRMHFASDGPVASIPARLPRSAGSAAWIAVPGP